MTHNEAQREMSVERYLLGELQGNARDEFEDHLFDCEICSADLQTGMAFTEGIKAGGPQLVSEPVSPLAYTPAWDTSSARSKSAPARLRVSGWAASLLQPWIAVPALAACLAVIAVQSFVVQPRLEHRIAQAETPSVVPGVTLNGAVRGLDGPEDTAEVQARPKGVFLISFGLPSKPGFRAFRCTLVAPGGKAVWHVELSPSAANDVVTINVPVGSTAPGVNMLKVEGVPPAGAPVALWQRSFRLKIDE